FAAGFSVPDSHRRDRFAQDLISLSYARLLFRPLHFANRLKIFVFSPDCDHHHRAMRSMIPTRTRAEGRSTEPEGILLTSLMRPWVWKSSGISADCRESSLDVTGHKSGHPLPVARISR